MEVEVEVEVDDVVGVVYDVSSSFRIASLVFCFS